MRTTDRLVSLFPALVLLASLAALWKPELFTWFTKDFITYGLGVTMLSMGLTLEMVDFGRVFTMPWLVCVGVVVQFIVMPLMGWFCARALNMPPAFTVGLVLVGCCPCGTASGIMCYLGKLDVPLSVTITSVTTILAVVLTPALTWLLLQGTRVDVDAGGLLRTTAQVILGPIALGVLLNHYTPRLTARVKDGAPVAAVLAVVLIVASIMGAGKVLILKSGFKLLFAVCLMHIGGFVFGYLLGKIMTRREIAARTVSIEVGMQNSGLGAVLAQRNFPLLAGAAIPCAISSLVHSLIASALAGWWRQSSDRYHHEDESRFRAL